jgi:mRNA interferase MazF
VILRGRVVWAVIDESVGRKPYVVVSNDARNQSMQSFLAARVTTSKKPEIPSVVPLPAGEPFRGSVLCDEVMMMWADEVVEDAGAISPPTMTLVDIGLRAALGLRR